MAVSVFPDAVKRGVESLIGRWSPVRTRPGVAVLCYHSVHPNSPFASVTPAEFEGHLRWLSDHCDVVALGAVLAAAHEKPRRPVVAITFDDGFEDNHRYAFPLLRALGLRATFFVSSGLIQAERPVRARFGVLCGVPPAAIQALSWAQVREMQRAGMEIGAHTHTHPSLEQLGDEDALAEIAVSKALIEEQVQDDVRSFAYPFGKPRIHFSDRISRMVAQAGFEVAVTIVYRRVGRGDDPLRIPRFAVNRDSIPTLAAKLSGRFDALGWWQEHGPRWWGRWISSDRSRRLAPIRVLVDDEVRRDAHA